MESLLIFLYDEKGHYVFGFWENKVEGYDSDLNEKTRASDSLFWKTKPELLLCF